MMTRRERQHSQVEEELRRRGLNASSAYEIAESFYVDTPKKRLWMATENVEKILRMMSKTSRGSPCIKLENGSLEKYEFDEKVMSMRRPPENMVRAEKRSRILDYYYIIYEELKRPVSCAQRQDIVVI